MPKQLCAGMNRHKQRMRWHGLSFHDVYVQWKSGSNKVASEVITTYKVQVEQLRQELKDEKIKLEM